MNYYLGIDNGGTTTKAALYDSHGREIAVAQTETEAIRPRPGYIERDMEHMWQANARVIRQAIEKAGIDSADVRGVACCGHGKGLYLWGTDGKPAYHGIISSDNRAVEYPIRWQKDGTEEKVFRLSLQHILASQPVSLLAWLKDNDPAVLAHTRWIFACKDYVRFRLTGVAKAEYTDYSGDNLVNLNTASYDRALLDLFGLADCLEKLPPLCRATDICGGVTEEAAAATGLRPGTPVMGGAFDIDACAIAGGITDDSRICMIAGTWSINEYIAHQPVLDGTVLMNSYYCLPDYYLVEESSATSAGNNEWFVNTLLPECREAAKQQGVSVYELMNQWVEALGYRAACPVFLPFLMASNVNPKAKGCFIGLSSFHTRAHLVRSVYEGIAFSHRYHLDKLSKSKKTPADCIRLTGGVAKSPVWTQMFADVMHMPVEVVESNETGALGCAIIARAAVENLPIEKACADMCVIARRVEPDRKAGDIYDEKYALYLKTADALDGVWEAFDTLWQ